MPLTLSVQSRLQQQHESLPDLIKGLSIDQLKVEISPGKWSALEQMVHLIAYQHTFLHRMQAIIQQDGPQFERYLAANDPLFHEYLQRSVPELLEDLKTHRFLINKHLLQLSETALRREGVHPLYGRFTVGQWAEFFLLHEAHHLFAIFMLTAAAKKAVQH